MTSRIAIGTPIAIQCRRAPRSPALVIVESFDSLYTASCPAEQFSKRCARYEPWKKRECEMNLPSRNYAPAVDSYLEHTAPSFRNSVSRRVFVAASAVTTRLGTRFARAQDRVYGPAPAKRRTRDVSVGGEF